VGRDSHYAIRVVDTPKTKRGGEEEDDHQNAIVNPVLRRRVFVVSLRSVRCIATKESSAKQGGKRKLAPRSTTSLLPSKTHLVQQIPRLLLPSYTRLSRCRSSRRVRPVVRAFVEPWVEGSCGSGRDGTGGTGSADGEGG
jgi:hypothetical protein